MVALFKMLLMLLMTASIVGLFSILPKYEDSKKSPIPLWVIMIGSVLSWLFGLMYVAP